MMILSLGIKFKLKQKTKIVQYIKVIRKITLIGFFKLYTDDSKKLIKNKKYKIRIRVDDKK